MSTTTIYVYFKPAGVLADATTVKLSSSDGTYGVKRTDTDAVVVADGTAMTKIATGTYYYGITDPAYDLTYQISVEIVYGGNTYYSVSTKTGTTTPATAGSYSPTTLTYWDLVGVAQQYLGWGPRPYEQNSTVGAGDVAGGQDYERIRALVDQAYLAFLNPPSVERNGRRHRWSFLSPSTTLTTVAGTYVYDLPADFASMASPLVFPDDVSGNKIEQCQWEEIYADRGLSTPGNDYPYRFALKPKPFSALSGQRWQIVLDPPPSGAWELPYRYNVTAGSKLSVSLCVGDGTVSADTTTLADADSTDFTSVGVAANDKIVVMDNNRTAGRPIPSTYLVTGTITAHGLSIWPNAGGAGDCRYEIYKAAIYPLGGTDHAGTLCAAVRAMAEKEEKGMPGPEWAFWMEQLKASIRQDQGLLAANLGYDGGERTRTVQVLKKEWYMDGVLIS